MSLERKTEEKEKFILIEAISNYPFFDTNYRPIELFEETERTRRWRAKSSYSNLRIG